jgi:hypothetical protein
MVFVKHFLAAMLLARVVCKIEPDTQAKMKGYYATNSLKS